MSALKACLSAPAVTLAPEFTSSIAKALRSCAAAASRLGGQEFPKAVLLPLVGHAIPRRCLHALKRHLHACAADGKDVTEIVARIQEASTWIPRQLATPEAHKFDRLLARGVSAEDCKRLHGHADPKLFLQLGFFFEGRLPRSRADTIAMAASHVFSPRSSGATSSWTWLFSVARTFAFGRQVALLAVDPKVTLVGYIFLIDAEGLEDGAVVVPEQFGTDSLVAAECEVTFAVRWILPEKVVGYFEVRLGNGDGFQYRFVPNPRCPAASALPS